jgi:hypothetical protein
MEKQNSQGNYIMGSFRVFILYQVKIRERGAGMCENLHAWDLAKFVRTFEYNKCRHKFKNNIKMHIRNSL